MRAARSSRARLDGRGEEAAVGAQPLGAPVEVRGVRVRLGRGGVARPPGDARRAAGDHAARVGQDVARPLGVPLQADGGLVEHPVELGSGRQRRRPGEAGANPLAELLGGEPAPAEQREAPGLGRTGGGQSPRVELPAGGHRRAGGRGSGELHEARVVEGHTVGQRRPGDAAEGVDHRAGTDDGSRGDELVGALCEGCGRLHEGVRGPRDRAAAVDGGGTVERE